MNGSYNQILPAPIPQIPNRPSSRAGIQDAFLANPRVEPANYIPMQNVALP